MFVHTPIQIMQDKLHSCNFTNDSSHGLNRVATRMSTHPSNLKNFTHVMGWMKIFPLKLFSSMFEKFGINTGIIFL